MFYDKVRAQRIYPTTYHSLGFHDIDEQVDRMNVSSNFVGDYKHSLLRKKFHGRYLGTMMHAHFENPVPGQDFSTGPNRRL